MSTPESIPLRSKPDLSLSAAGGLPAAVKPGTLASLKEEMKEIGSSCAEAVRTSSVGQFIGKRTPAQIALMVTSLILLTVVIGVVAGGALPDKMVAAAMFGTPMTVTALLLVAASLQPAPYPPLQETRFLEASQANLNACAQLMHRNDSDRIKIQQLTILYQQTQHVLREKFVKDYATEKIIGSTLFSPTEAVEILDKALSQKADDTKGTTWKTIEAYIGVRGAGPEEQTLRSKAQDILNAQASRKQTERSPLIHPDKK